MTKPRFPINDQRRRMANRAVRHWAFARHWGLIGHWDLGIVIRVFRVEVDDEHV